MRRRHFINFLGGAAATWPLGARAQQPVMPLIGLLAAPNAASYGLYVDAFRQGLKEAGYIEGQNVAIESRFAEGKLGIVASLARPGDNITGVSFLLSDLAEKEVELLHELVPKAAVIGFLVDPNDPVTESDTKSAQAAANALGHELVIVKASSKNEIAPAVATLAQQGIKALFVNADPLFNVNFPEIRMLAARDAMLTISSWEGFTADGNLITRRLITYWRRGARCQLFS